MANEREILRAYLQSQSWDCFFTATFRVHQRYSATAIERVYRSFGGNITRPAKAFIAAEQHYLGGWHCHGLLQFSAGWSHWTGLSLGLAANALGRLGFNSCSAIGDQSACSAYLSKYLLKGEKTGDWQSYGRKKFWAPLDTGLLDV